MARRRRKAIGFYTDRRTGKVKPITSRRRRWKGKTIFFPAKYEKYAEIVRIDNPDAARGSVKQLTEEFHKADTREKKRRIVRMMVLAANRAAAAAKKEKLSDKERREFLEVEAIYRNAYRQLKVR
jgi:hypothetical protein